MKILALIILAIILIFLSRTKTVKMILALATLVLCSYYLSWEPNPEADLNWHYHFGDDVSYLSFWNIISMNADNVRLISSIYTVKFITTCPVFSLFVWLLTFLGNKYLLPFVVASIIYFASYKLIFLTQQKTQLSVTAIKIGAVYVLCMTNFFGLGGLRNPLSYALFALILYYDFEGRMKRGACYASYIMLCLVHSSCFILLGFRVLFMFVSKMKMKEKYVYIILFLLIVGMELVLNVVGSFGGVLQTVVASEKGYLLSGSSVVNGYSKAIKIVNYAWLAYLFYWYGTDRKNQYRDILKYCRWILFFAILNVQNYDVFVRMSYFLLPISTIFVADLINVRYNRHKFKTVLFAVCSLTLLWMSFTAYNAMD